MYDWLQSRKLFCFFASIAALLIVAGGITRSASAGDGWTTVTGSSGVGQGSRRVTVALPQPVQKHAQPLPSGNGAGRIVIYKASASPGMFFNVAFINYPDAVVRKMHQSPVPFQERVLQGLMRKKPGSRREATPRLSIPSGASSAREYRFGFPHPRVAGLKGHTVARTYLVGDTLCLLFVDIVELPGAKTAPLIEQNTARFFKSVSFGK